MSQWRHDPITGRSVIIAKNRADRPNEFKPATGERKERPCPFCEVGKPQTPAPLAVFPADAGDRWQVKVVPNKYPALDLDAAPNDASGLTAAGVAPGFGSHEVVIESARHLPCFSRLSDEEALQTFLAYQQRLLVHRENPRLSYVQVFKNAGPAGGASIEHVHSQLMAVPFVPPPVQRELAACEEFFRRKGKCAFCDLIGRELADHARVVYASKHWVALCPPVSRFPYETWILPRRHAARFEEVAVERLSELARFVRKLTGVITAIAGKIAYNHLFRWAPFDTSEFAHYHWRMELFPRMVGVAAFEWATDYFVNPVPPEEAATVLRERCVTYSD